MFPRNFKTTLDILLIMSCHNRQNQPKTRANYYKLNFINCACCRHKDECIRLPKQHKFGQQSLTLWLVAFSKDIKAVQFKRTEVYFQVLEFHTQTD